MYLDSDELRPDVPRIPSAISPLERLFLTLTAYALLVAVAYFLPRYLPAPAPTAVILPRPDQTVQFVQMMPLVDRSAPPKNPTEFSDIDRRSATRERAPKPENEAPLSRGNTPEKVEGAKAERPAGPDSPDPARPSPSGATAPSNVTTKVLPDIVPPAPPAGGRLGDSLRNLQRYLQGDAFDNPRGGQTTPDPDIQFDSKGVEFGPWIRRFIAQVKQNWLIPESAFMSGHVVLQFYVEKSGAITDLHVVQPSVYESFTNAALIAIRTSNPTLPLPPEYPLDRALFTVTFHYNEGIR